MTELTKIKNKYNKMNINEKINFRQKIVIGKSFLETMLLFSFLKTEYNFVKKQSIYSILK